MPIRGHNEDCVSGLEYAGWRLFARRPVATFTREQVLSPLETEMKMLLVSVVFSAGLLIASVGHAQQSSAGSTATCKDGSSYSGTSKRGACSGHGGVKNWNAAHASVAASQPMAASKPMPAAVPVAASASMAAMATCKDGSSYSGASKRGACSGHGGVKNWSGNNAPMSATPAPMATTRLPAAAPMATTSAPMSASTPKPAHQPTAMPTQAAAGAAPGSVWVNTSSKVYHCSNDKWYGKTKQGAYMSESEARSKGFRPEHGKSCS